MYLSSQTETQHRFSLIYGHEQYKQSHRMDDLLNYLCYTHYNNWQNKQGCMDFSGGPKNNKVLYEHNINAVMNILWWINSPDNCCFSKQTWNPVDTSKLVALGHFLFVWSTAVASFISAHRGDSFVSWLMLGIASTSQIKHEEDTFRSKRITNSPPGSQSDP